MSKKKQSESRKTAASDDEIAALALEQARRLLETHRERLKETKANRGRAVRHYDEEIRRQEKIVKRLQATVRAGDKAVAKAASKAAAKPKRRKSGSRKRRTST